MLGDAVSGLIDFGDCLDNPLICDGDGPIPEFRRWAAQFRSGGSAIGDAG